MKKSHFGLYAVLAGLLILAGSLTMFRRVWLQPKDADWTPPHLAMALDNTTDRFEILVGGTPIQKVLDAKGISIAKDGNMVPLAAADVQVRVNNYEKNRLERLPLMIVWAAVAGGALVLLLIGLFTPMIGAFRPPNIVDLNMTGDISAEGERKAS